MSSGTVDPRPPRLEDKYARDDGTVFMTGVQALARLPLVQVRRDRRAGLRTGVLVSGYPGSPLGGYDLELERIRLLLEQHDVKHVPALNEEVGAAIVWGSQMTQLFGESSYDGVTGIWYGKAPGVDRSLDLFRHGNLAGGPRHSGMLALAGDDPYGKSSTIPGYSEWDLAACAMPVLAPASVGELLSLGLHAIALSRLTGLWVGMKCVTNLCDGAATVTLDPASPRITVPDAVGFEKPSSFTFVGVQSLELERHIWEERVPLALEYARANDLNTVVQRGPSDRIGLVASGKTFTDLMQALDDLGLTSNRLRDLGIGVMKVGMIHPLEARSIREFAAGLDELVVIEEKRNLLELQVRDALYGVANAPRVLGKQDSDGNRLFPHHGELDADAIAERLGAVWIARGRAPESVETRVAEIASIRARDYAAFAQRSPNYCSGCPHNRSTLAVDGELVGGGIGCSGMSVLTTQPERSALYIVPMGAEGAPWIGASPWVETAHLFQNVGDGTFFHSGSQSLRAAVAAGVNITYKLLYNSAIAMTGGQGAVGAMDVLQLTHVLSAFGVSRTIVVAEHPDRLKALALAPNAKVYDRSRYEEAVRELGVVPGVTVLLFDQQCAAEKRRARKRGKQPQPVKYVFINEDVCEGCGDCGRVSNCMSVQPVETEFGRKTQVDQASCNNDYSCVNGDCPSFLTVYTAKGLRKKPPPDVPDDIPEPSRRAVSANGYSMYMPGIGGTGVVTANHVLSYAALMDGKHVHALDQTGLAQKGGAVVSSLRIYEGDDYLYASNKVGVGQADLVLAFDALGVVAPANADRLSPGRTVVVGDPSARATAEAVRHVSFPMPTGNAIQREVDRYSRAEENIWNDGSRVSDHLFADHAFANIFLIGTAYQAGVIPISSSSIEAAIRLNGVAVEDNLRAFRCGRLYLHDPSRVRALLRGPTRDFDEIREEKRTSLGRSGAEYERLLNRCSGLGVETQRILALRIGELISYQNVAYAERYVELVLAVAARDASVGQGEELTRAVAVNLYKLMAYKDEYEVARLLLKGEWSTRIRDQFLDAKVKFNLHPPLLRGKGLDRKLELGRWFTPFLRLLIPLRRLRGTHFDVFGRTEVRALERELIHWYTDVVSEVTAELDASNYALAVAVASAPDRVRGYESLKVASADAVRRSVAESLRAMHKNRDVPPGVSAGAAS